MIEMRKSLIVLGLFFIIIWVLVVYAIWIEEISLNPQFMATAINGIATSTAVTVGFTTTSITFGFSNRIFDLKKDVVWLIVFLMSLMFSIASLYNAYQELGSSEFQTAYRYAMTGFTNAMITILASILLLIFALDRKGGLK